MKRIFFLLALITICSCNKDKLYSKRLMKPGTWQVTELSVDGIEDQKTPYWEIDDCDIYEASCTGRWVHPNIEYANFVWQFTNKGSSFTLNRINGADSCNFITDSVEIQCYNYSGKYEVVEHKRNAMVFKSLETTGYPNNEVILKIEKP